MRGKMRRPSGDWLMPRPTIVVARRTPSIARPWKVTVPFLGRSSPEIVRSVVDLPAPLEPMSVTISPCVDRERQALHRGDVAVVDVHVVELEHRSGRCLCVDSVRTSRSLASAPDLPR